MPDTGQEKTERIDGVHAEFFGGDRYRVKVRCRGGI